MGGDFTAWFAPRPTEQQLTVWPTLNTKAPPTPAPEPPPAPVTAPPVAPEPEPAPAPPPIDLDAVIAEAYARGRADAEAACAPKLARLERELAVLPAIVAGADTVRATALREASDDIGRIVAALGARLLGATMIDAAVVARTVRESLDRMQTRDPVRVRVSPAVADKIRAGLAGEAQVEVVADASVTGGAVLESEGARIDATLGAALEGLDRAIAAWKESR